MLQQDLKARREHEDFRGQWVSRAGLRGHPPCRAQRCVSRELETERAGARPLGPMGQLWRPGVFLGCQSPGPCARGWGGMSGSPSGSWLSSTGQRLPHQNCCGCWRGASWSVAGTGRVLACQPWHCAPTRASPRSRADSAGKNLIWPLRSHPVTTAGSRPPQPGLIAAARSPPRWRCQAPSPPHAF